MSNEIALRAAAADALLPDIADPLMGFDRRPTGQQEQTIFKKLHRLLKGRYKWCFLLGAVGAMAGAAGGYKSTKPVYRSTGMVRVIPRTLEIFGADANAVLANFDAFVESQVALLQSQRVIDMALNQDEWKVLKRGLSDDVVIDFTGRLNVVRPPRNEIILINYEDIERSAAVAGTRGIVNSYYKIYGETEIGQHERRMQALQEHVGRLDGEQRAKRAQIDTIAARHGTDDLRDIFRGLVDERGRYRSAYIDADLALGLSGVAEGGAAASRPSAFSMTVAQIAAEDLMTSNLVLQLTREESILKAKRETFGDKHTQVRAQEKQVEVAQATLDQRVAQYRELAASGQRSAQVLAAGLSPAQLRARRETLKEQVGGVDARILGVGKDMLEIENLRLQADVIRKQIDETNERIQQIKVSQQRNLLDHVEVLSAGDRALVVKDNRVQLSAVGSMGGLVAGFAAVLVWSLLDRRMRSPDDLIAGKITMLGVLPSLPDDLADPEQAAVAAHCVHQIRTLLQIGADAAERRVFAITSPASGTGKTSLTLSLGVSFAAASSRTLLIDCDLSGGGLTHRVDTIIRRKIGQILKREGLVTQPQLEAAMRLAHNSQRKLGEVLVELGYLTPEDVAKALTVQEEAPVGLVDALAGEPIDDCVAETGINGLSILPLGSATAQDVSKISPNGMRRLIEAARKKYDVVLIDTGPVPGCLEASVAAAAADGTVLVVSRGDQRPLAERSIQHLNEIGAAVAGMVFNRADTRDMAATSAPPRSPAAPPTGAALAARSAFRGGAVGEDARFGPVAFAVASRSQQQATGGNGNSSAPADGRKQQP